MNRTTYFYLLIVCAIPVCGCASPTIVPTIMPTVTATATATPTILPTATATIQPTTPVPTITATPAPTATPLPTETPNTAPIYTVTCSFSGLVLNSTATVITGIDGNIINTDTGNVITGNIDEYSYQFFHVSAGSYELIVDVEYTVYYENNTTSARTTRIMDSFGVNGNVDKTYPLY